MGLPNIASPRLPYVPPVEGGRPTLLSGDPNVILAVDLASKALAAPQRTAVVRDLPGWGETYLDSEFAQKIDAFVRNAQEKNVTLKFLSGYRSPAYQEYMPLHPKETGVIYPPAKDSLHQAGLAVDVDYKTRDDATKQIILDAAKRAGLNWGGAYNDPNHFDFDPAPGVSRDPLIKGFVEQVKNLQISRMRNPL
jgi:hypothetical protein